MGHIYADVEAQLYLLGWNYIVIVVINHNGNGNPIVAGSFGMGAKWR